MRHCRGADNSDGDIQCLVIWNEGIKPVATSPKSGCARSISARNERPTVPTKVIIKASIARMPNFCRYNKRKVSSTVMVTPHTSGKPVNNCIPMAIPSTSARFSSGNGDLC